jgi:hypothetical protein
MLKLIISFIIAWLIVYVIYSGVRWIAKQPYERQIQLIIKFFIGLGITVMTGMVFAIITTIF